MVKSVIPCLWFPMHCWDPIRLEPGQVFCMLPLSLLASMCYSPVVCTVSLASYITSDSYNLSASSSPWIPGPGREEFGGGIPFRSEYSIVSHSLHIVQLWDSVSVPSS